LLADTRATPESIIPILQTHAVFWLAAAPQYDMAGHRYDAHAPIHLATAATCDAVHTYLRSVPDLPVILDAVLADTNAEFREADFLAPAGN